MKTATAAACVAFVLGAMTGGGTHAQLIYRCGAEYSQTPCPGGKVLASSDPRTEAQRAEALRVAAQDRRRAAQLERERRALERATEPAMATGFNGRPAPPDDAASVTERGNAKRRPKLRRANDGAFVAVEPVRPKPQKAK